MRESGILMPVSSLPGPYGIGCFGKEAFKFVDFLADAGQKIWQILPLSPTGYGDSPYQSCSAFAGNPYFIDLDALKEEGLLTAAQLKAEDWGKNPKEVDMEASSIFVECWHGPWCYEKSTMEDSATFPMSEEGREEMRRWLEEKI